MRLAKMVIQNGYIDIPKGKTASVVTHLEMFGLPSKRAERSEASWTLRRATFSNPERYRTLFRRIGADWLWTSRLRLDDVELLQTLNHPFYETYLFNAYGDDEGLAELDFRSEGECELKFFGLTKEMIGQGVGRWMMNRVLDIAWSRPINRLWVHTCTFDHPSALHFYVRSGFVAYRRQIEVEDDPRMVGLLPKTAAPHVATI